MLEEGFVNQAYNIIKEKDLTSRFQANQGHFNGPNESHIDGIAKSAVIIAISIYNNEVLYDQLNPHIERALKAVTQGEIRAVIQDVNEMLATVE